MWDYYKFHFSSSGTGQYKTPTNSWWWNHSAGGDDKWQARPIIDAPIDVSDANSDIFVQYDTASTDIDGDAGQNNSDDADLHVVGASIGSTGVTGGRFDGSSSGNAYYTESTIIDNIISSFALTDAPPLIKLRYQNLGSSSGHLLAFVSFRKNPNQ